MAAGGGASKAVPPFCSAPSACPGRSGFARQADADQVSRLLFVSKMDHEPAEVVGRIDSYGALGDTEIVTLRPLEQRGSAWSFVYNDP